MSITINRWPVKSAAKIYLFGAYTIPVHEQFDPNLLSIAPYLLRVHILAVVPGSVVLASMFFVIFLFAGSNMATPLA